MDNHSPLNTLPPPSDPSVLQLSTPYRTQKERLHPGDEWRKKHENQMKDIAGLAFGSQFKKQLELEENIILANHPEHTRNSGSVPISFQILNNTIDKIDFTDIFENTLEQIDSPQQIRLAAEQRLNLLPPSITGLSRPSPIQSSSIENL